MRAWAEVGMPEVLLQRRVEEGACASSEVQICCLKGGFRHLVLGLLWRFAWRRGEWKEC